MFGARNRTGNGDIPLTVQDVKRPSVQEEAGCSAEVADVSPGRRQTVEKGPAVALRIDEGDPAVVGHVGPALGDKEIAARGDNLDITWLKDNSGDPEDGLETPEDIASAIEAHLMAALVEVRALVDELGDGVMDADALEAVE